ncbi:MAG: glycosyltransferase [Acidobacteriia bacterium]|nr:glycosyltransferase [Terriglobia bacterium]
MLTVAYLANQFPVAVEPYVAEEIAELRLLGVRVVTGTVTRANRQDKIREDPDVAVRPLQVLVLVQAVWLCLWRWDRIADLVARVLFHGPEGLIRRVKALLHTLLGVCYAVRLQTQGVEHIHVHHGYSASWIAMAAARLLDLKFSLTLHGSDLLLHRAYLDVKLQNCRFCLTISEYNRRFIATHYPAIDPAKVFVARLGVEVPETEISKLPARRNNAEPIHLLAVGRLHAVKDHAFLLRACDYLQAEGLDFCCEIAGDGPERRRLESVIRELGLENRVKLLGHISPEQTDSLYRQADLVVLTSRSEGIPLVLMEAMAQGKLVLAPAITGIPELVIAGKTGFLYEPGSIWDFLEKVMEISCLLGKGPPLVEDTPEKWSTCEVLRRAIPTDSADPLDWVRHAARVQICLNFNRQKNLQLFTDLFLQNVFRSQGEALPHASSVLQQI